MARLSLLLLASLCAVACGALVAAMPTEHHKPHHATAASASTVLGAIPQLKQDGYTPSATPLILLSPEISVWSSDNDLFTSDTRHWAGQSMGLAGALRVDGVVFGFLGNFSNFGSGAQTLVQQSKFVLPSSTIYLFSTPAGPQAGIQLQVLFTSVVDDLSSETDLSRPYSYVTFSVNNTNAAGSANSDRDVSLYFDVHSDWTLDALLDPSQNIAWEPLTPATGQNWVGQSIRNYDSIPFSRKGDFVKMNWGTMFMSAPSDSRLTQSTSSASSMREGFGAGGPLPPTDSAKVRAFWTDPVSAAFQWDLGTLSAQASTGAFCMVGYDDLYSMSYFNEWQQPLWRNTFGGDMNAMITDGIQSFEALLPRLMKFDQTLWAELVAAGGDAYAVITSLAYRQVTGGIKGVWSEPLAESRWYMKEISSDGDISTVDVIYPASPFFLAFGPDILRKMLLPLFDYALNRTNIDYNLPWAPHHLGFWPVADITAGQQEQMPMEESANFFLMLSGIASAQKNNVDWLGPYWPLLKTWGDYLVSSLPDPGNQLCTDDFEGPSPHNVNLALKGVVGLGAYSQLLTAAGQPQEAKDVMQAAEGFATQWSNMSGFSAGGATRLQYDLPGSWSMKYNLLFHYILDMDLLPASTIMSQEVAFYKTQVTPWGLPLDSRGPLTKTDWTSWIAAMSSDEDFSTLLFDRIFTFIMTSPTRAIPFSDWYSTADGHVLGFQARPVQGGLFANYLLKQQAKK